MKVNLGNYLETIIKQSNYSKKDLWNLLSSNFEIGDKPISYTTFSNNIKTGDITLNEAIALSTLINLDFNFLVNTIKSEVKKCSIANKKNANNILDVELTLSILNNHIPVKDIFFTKDDLHEQEFGSSSFFDALYCDENLEKVYLCRLTIEDHIATILTLGNFDCFKDYLDKNDLEEFSTLDLSEKMNVVEFTYDKILSILNKKEEPITVVY